MGVFVDYVLSAECDEAELVRRLERVRQRCLDLPLKAVGQVRRIAPVYNPVNMTLFQSEGLQLPEVIKQRLEEADLDSELEQICILFGFLPADDLPQDLQDRYIAPALELIETTDIWKSEDLPEKVVMSTRGLTSYTVYRGGIELEFANIMLRHGYALIISPGEGSESMTLGLSTYAKMPGSQISEPPLWHGKSFTRTQYARDFIHVHETVCHVLDIVKAEGLLFSAGDTCGYYADRSWKEAGQRVNEEMIFAKIMSGLIDVEIGNLREEGVSIKVLEDNASKAKPVDFSSRLKPDPEEAENPE